MLQRARTGGGLSDILASPEVRLVGDRTALPLDRRVDRAAGRRISLSCSACAELVRRFKVFLLGVWVLENQRTSPTVWPRDHLLIALALIGIFFSAGAVAFQVSAQEQALGLFRWRSAK